MNERICEAGWVMAPMYRDGANVLWAAERENGSGEMHFHAGVTATRAEVLRAFAWACAPRDRRLLPTAWLLAEEDTTPRMVAARDTLATPLGKLYLKDGRQMDDVSSARVIA